MNQSEKKDLETRNLYIDEVRGIAVILMIIGHCIQYGSGNSFLKQQLYFENWAFRAIYSFHMPLFALIAGYFLASSLQKRDSCKVFKSRMLSLGLPILSWGTINYIILVLNQGIDFGLTNIIKQIFWNYLGTLWFLWALMCCTFVTIAIHKFCDGSLSAFGIILFVLLFLPEKYNIQYFCFLYPFFGLGYLWEKSFQGRLQKKLYNWQHSLVTGVILLIIWGIMVGFFHQENYIYQTGFSLIGKKLALLQIGIDIFRIVIGLVGSCAVLLCYKVMHIRLGNIPWLAWLGQNSMGMYIVNSYVNLYILKYICVNSSENLLFSCILSVPVTIICLVLTVCISRNRLLNRLLLGGR